MGISDFPINRILNQFFFRIEDCTVISCYDVNELVVCAVRFVKLNQAEIKTAFPRKAN